MKQIVKTLIVLVVFSTLISAQKFDKSQIKDYDQFVKNLKTSLVAESPGIQQNAIKLAGMYKVEDVVSELEDLIEETANEKTKVLIAQTLFDIGDESSMEMLNELSKTEKSKYVKDFYNNLCKQYFSKEKIAKSL